MTKADGKKRHVATIKDVAARAGVSTATVSKYLNQLQNFSPEVEARIAEAVRDLGYHQNPLARSIITGRSGTIGLSIPDIFNPFFAALVTGASRVAAERGYTVLLVDSESGEESERKALADLCMRADGLILSSRHPLSAWSWLEEMPKPVVLFGTMTDGLGRRIGLKNELAGKMVISYLHRLGHRKIAFVGFDGAISSSERWEGMKALADELGLELQIVNARETTPEEGARCCKLLLLGSGVATGIDAVICFNDMLAFGFMRQAHELGLSIPKDCSVVGFDNVLFCDLVLPRLTSVNMGGERLGEIAAMQLLDRLHDRDRVIDMPDPELVLRDSVFDRRR